MNNIRNMAAKYEKINNAIQLAKCLAIEMKNLADRAMKLAIR